MIAYVLDALVVAVLFTVGGVLAGLVSSVLGARVHELTEVVVSVLLVALPAVLALYCALFWALAGRTPGMALLGLRVVTVRARRPSWVAAVARALVLAYFPIGALWSLVDRRQQALHDKLARTLVIRT